MAIVHRRSSHLLSLLNLAIAMAIGETLMLGIATFVRRLYHGPAVVQWVMAASIIAIGGYLIFGYPMLRKWQKGNASLDDDPRVNWAVRLVERGGPLFFLLGSAIGGSPAIGWYAGARNKPNAKVLTFVAACILGATWGAIYLAIGTGLLNWLGW